MSPTNIITIVICAFFYFDGDVNIWHEIFSPPICNIAFYWVVSWQFEAYSVQHDVKFKVNMFSYFTWNWSFNEFLGCFFLNHEWNKQEMCIPCILLHVTLTNRYLQTEIIHGLQVWLSFEVMRSFFLVLEDVMYVMNMLILLFLAIILLKLDLLESNPII